MKTAVLHVPHIEGERSCKMMLESAGYTVYGIHPELVDRLRFMPRPIRSHVKPQATGPIFDECNLFVHVKHFGTAEVLKHFPRLKNRLLWFCINGGRPGVHTPQSHKMPPLKVPTPFVGSLKAYRDDSKYNVSGPRYVSYIPLVRKDDYELRTTIDYENPITLIHNARGWGGYGWITDRLIEIGIDMYGKRSPKGFLTPPEVREKLSMALCYVHMKSQDCPGYSLYEAMLTGCPVVLPQQFIDHTQYHDLYEHGETCLVVPDDKYLRGNKSPERASELVTGVQRAVERLRDPTENQRISRNGRKRLLGLMWNTKRDGPVFKTFMEKHFGE